MTDPARPQAPFDVDPAPRLELDDIQGIVLRGISYHYGRYLFFRFDDTAGARRFVQEIIPRITDSEPGADGRKKKWAMCVAFTYPGLRALGVPERSLDTFSLPFKQGMQARAELLVDTNDNAPSRWEAPWRGDDIHAWIGIGAHDALDPDGTPQDGQEVIARESLFLRDVSERNRVTLVELQEAGMLRVDGAWSNREHFGYADGFGNPDVAGSGFPMSVGNGATDARRGWRPVAAGEFVLGHANEDGEIDRAPLPSALSRNGSYMVYRKLHQRVSTFRRYMRDAGRDFPGGEERLMAKFVGRWPDGTPLAKSPGKAWGDAHPVAGAHQLTPAELLEAMRPYTDFTYTPDDGAGFGCPLGAHIRRVNPRDALGFDGVLVNSHRILRRGLPYGDWVPPSVDPDTVADEGPDGGSLRGVCFMVINADIERQFEFVQREWMNYGNDFRQGNDPDPLVGNHSAVDAEAPNAELLPKHVVPGDPSALGGYPTRVCFGLPNFVAVRGGAYFFVPSITALGAIGRGSVEGY
ncbi:MAG: Dyp-type peroxidase [Gemmatimonadaceae bacterium]